MPGFCVDGNLMKLADTIIALAEYMLDAYNAEHSTNFTLDSDAKLYNALMNEAEAKKKTLSALSPR